MPCSPHFGPGHTGECARASDSHAGGIATAEVPSGVQPPSLWSSGTIGSVCMHQQGPEHQEMQMDTMPMHGTEHRDEPLHETAAPRGKEGAEVHHGGCIPCSFASSALRKALQGEKGQDRVAGCPHQCCKQPQPQDTHNVDKGSSKGNPPNLR